MNTRSWLKRAPAAVFNFVVVWVGFFSQILASPAFCGASYRELAGARQTMYQHGVPHTDRNGHLQTATGGASFFPRCAYETLPGMLDELRRAGFNCFKPWNGMNVDAALAEAGSSGMQLVKEWAGSSCGDCIVKQTSAAAGDDRILGWIIEDEPTGCINEFSTCLTRISAYRELLGKLHRLDPYHPVFALDIPLPGPGALAMWSEVNGSGNIAAIDSYPFHAGGSATLESSAENYKHLVELNAEQKPLWITVQAFAMPTSAAGAWIMPRPQQLRAEVFAALVHGATGIFYFAIDSWAARNAQVIGIAASPSPSYPADQPEDAVATPTQLAASRALWDQAVRLNNELARLQPIIFSDTALLPYRVAVRGRARTAVPIRAMLKTLPDGSHCLLVVNIEDAPFDVLITFKSQPQNVRRVDEHGDAHVLETKAGGINDKIDGYGVRIYTFRCSRCR